MRHPVPTEHVLRQAFDLLGRYRPLCSATRALSPTPTLSARLRSRASTRFGLRDPERRQAAGV